MSERLGATVPIVTTDSDSWALVALATVLTTSACLPLVRRMLMAAGMLDIPNTRSSHTTPIPRGGGIAFVLALALTAPLWLVLGSGALADRWFALVPVGWAVAMSLVGLLDDRRGLGVGPRLAAQVGVGVGAGWTLGSSLLWAVVGALVVPLLVNVTNFMDGINGISAGTGILWGVTALAIGSVHSQTLALLGALSAGLCLSFLPWNVPRARLFLGDTGSYLLGGLYSAGLIAAMVEAPSVSPVVVAPLGLFVIDVMWTLARRAMSGQRVGVAHRDHVYQRLVHVHGLSHVAVALTVVVLSGVATLCLVLGEPRAGLVVMGSAAAVYLCLPSALGALRAPQVEPTRRERLGASNAAAQNPVSEAARRQADATRTIVERLLRPRVRR